MEEYYVYVWIREDYNTIFYVGKGKDWRATNMQNRGKYFMNIYNNYPTRVEKLHENLTESQAFELEKSTIEELLSEGYTINIKGYGENKGKHLVNKTLGGEGVSGRVMSDEQKAHMSEIKRGKKLSNEQIEKIKQYYKENLNPNSQEVVCLNNGYIYESKAEASRQNNTSIGLINRCLALKSTYAGVMGEEPLVWVSPKEYSLMSREEIDYKLGVAKNHHSKLGEHNSFFGKKHSEKTKRLISQKMTSEAIENIRAKQGTSVYCVELDKVFSSMNFAVEYIYEHYKVVIYRPPIKKQCEKLGEGKGYGEIILNGEVTKLHWEYANNHAERLNEKDNE